MDPEVAADLVKTTVTNENMAEFAFKDTKMADIVKQEEYRSLYDTHRKNWYNY